MKAAAAVGDNALVSALKANHTAVVAATSVLRKVAESTLASLPAGTSEDLKTVYNTSAQSFVAVLAKFPKGT